MKLKGDYLEDMAQLEHCKCYEWGENLLRVFDEDGDGYLVNKATGKARLIDGDGLLLGFTDEEIDYATIDKLENSHNAHPRRIAYAGINRYDNCKNGIFALCWMLYPDGQYFADEDGYGMEDNDELTVYCIMDDDLNVIRPFTRVPDIKALLAEFRSNKQNRLIGSNSPDAESFNRLPLHLK